MNTIIIYSKSNYGNTSWYVTDPTLAKHVAALTGKKTVDITNVAALNALGFTVKSYHNGELIDAINEFTCIV